MKGCEFYGKYDKFSNDKVIEYFKMVFDLDILFVLVYVGLGDVIS